MQMTGLHETSSSKPELTQHHGQMACRTTPALTYLSLSLCLSCSICAIPLLATSFYLNLSVCLFFLDTFSLSVAPAHFLFLCLLRCPSVFLSVSFSLADLLHFHDFQVSADAPVELTTNFSTKPKLYQLKSTKTARG